MYNQAEEAIVDIRSLLRTILTNFLMSVATGVSMNDFLTVSDQVHQLIRLFEELQADNSSLSAQINSATEIMESQEQALQQRADLPLPEITSLLSRALVLLGGAQPVEDNPSAPEDIFGRTTGIVTGTVAGTPYIIRDVGIDFTIPDTEELVETVDFDGDIDGDMLEEDSIPVEDIPYEEVDEDDFDLEDEDLDDVLQPVSQDASEEIVKNPEITEDFTNVENSHMVTFIGVRYSHLPYHYTIGDVRYKLVINGSQIVSTRV